MDATDPHASEVEDENTVVVNRRASGLSKANVARTKIASEGEDEDDRTVVVDRGADARSASAKPRTTRKGSIGPAPVPSDFAPPAVKGADAAAITRYRPKAVPPPRPQIPPMDREPATTREPSATMPSVARHARVTARAAVAVFVVSSVASIVGLTLIALTLHARR
jgi:hypothetical protein